MSASALNLIARNLSSVTVRRGFGTSLRRTSGGHDEGGYVGSTMPFSVKNRYKLCVISTLFWGSGCALPFLILRHQLLKG